METRELYKQKYQAQLREWSAKFEVMKAQSEKLTAQAKLDVKPLLDAAHAKLASAKAKLDELAGTTDDKWDNVVNEASRTWSDLKAAAEGAAAALQRGGKD
jgi:hypothetical protein